MNVTLNGTFCHEADFKVEASTVQGQKFSTALFNVSVWPFCPPNLKILNMERYYESYTANATLWSQNTVIFSGGNHFYTLDNVNCPIESLELYQNGMVYSGNCVVFNNNTGSLKFNERFCWEENLKVKINSRGKFVFSDEFDVHLKVDCKPHIHY